jgi:hypothetical protein
MMALSGQVRELVQCLPELSQLLFYAIFILCTHNEMELGEGQRLAKCRGRMYSGFTYSVPCFCSKVGFSLSILMNGL